MTIKTKQAANSFFALLGLHDTFHHAHLLSVIDIFGWDRLGQLGHGVFIGFQPSQLFLTELGQLGQIVLASPVLSGKLATFHHH
ncbi:hypothetical protein [Methylobacillus flagellatus]|uniref:hypothetical protein n=1 Tax=Methylobacillus flagellatus TaxID=405 RepID=UPI0010F5FC8F|nr:hypothetical protein [Methylobacillus flagellatus]